MSLLNWADYTILGVISFSTLISLTRGFIREALSLVTWGVSLWIAFHFAEVGATFLTNYVQSPSLRLLASFVILLVLSLICGAIINYVLGQIVDKTGLTGTDKILGLVFGMLRGVLVLAILVIVARLTPMPEEEWWKSSLLIPYFRPVEVWLYEVLPESVLEHLPKSLKESKLKKE